MELTWTQQEFAVLEKEALRRPRSRLAEWLDAVERHGPLMPRANVPFVVDLSRQRVKELIDAGRIATVWVHNREYVPIKALDLFMSEERKAGRPMAELSLAESFRKNWVPLVRKTFKK